MDNKTIHLNGVDYAWPTRPIVVVCIDGGDPAYIERGIADGILPNIESCIQRGFSGVAAGAVPSLTCPNNMSLITGAPASVHGISGNYYLDAATGKEVVMTGPELLRSPTLLKQFADAGAKVVSITAKDKLRRQLGKDLDLARGNISFSSENSDQCTLAENGIENVLELVGRPLPDMYSADLSLFVLEAGIRLLERVRPQLMFLSLTDYIQHKNAPGDPVADDFFKHIDACFGRLESLGAIVALTADHGMNDKSLPDGSPNVVYLQDIINERFGADTARVVCPITDSFVRHHGALGGFVRVWIRDHQRVSAADIIAHICRIPGVAEAPDREGEVAVIADANTVIGGSANEHDLSALRDARLRSHGGVSEASVPFILSAPLNETYRTRAVHGLKSYQLFDYTINGTR
ncbi:MAG: phosphonoacetate hydrolase [Candidatus Protistobacter heckmanni]|nr:phosphonoacetate hydrolase [Candidatus Protistobacter heckmanni]